MFILTVFEILLFERWSALSSTQQGTTSERVKFSVKYKKNVPKELIDSNISLGSFEWFIFFF